MGLCRVAVFLKSMKKILIPVIACLPILQACTTSGCRVEGTVDNAKNGDTVFIATLNDTQFIPSDTLLIENGKFKLTRKNCDSTEICSYYYQTADNEVYSNIFFAEKGKVKIHIGEKPTISGTENNDIYQTFVDSLYTIHEKMNTLYNKAIEESGTDLNLEDFEGSEELNSLDRQATEIIHRHIEKYADKPAGYFIFLSCYHMYSPDEILDVIAILPEAYQNTPFINHLKNETLHNLSTTVGQPFINVSIPDINGQTLDLRNIVENNKLTLVDCWASWCGPCCMEMPNVVDLYAKYKSKGLEIVGISFDKDKNSWKKAVKEMNMTWPQVSELKSWDNEMAQLYGISSIPYTILIDQKGTIVAKQLRGEELERFVADFLK